MHDHEVLAEIPEFADVPRPFVRRKRRHRLRRDADLRQRIFACKKLQIVVDQNRNIRRALSQRWKHQRDNREPVVKIFAERSLFYHFREIAVCCADEAHVQLDLLLRAEPFDAVRFQKSQQLHLRREIDFADFVKKKRAAVRRFKAPDPPLCRAGERAFLVAENFAFQERRRYRRAVHGDKRLFRSRRTLVNELREKLFAGARFAEKQNRGFRESHALCLRDCVFQGRALADELREAELLLQARRHRLVFLRSLAGFQRAPDHELELVDV